MIKYDYAQPRFYRFSDDTLLMVKNALLNNPSKFKSVWDIGCGSGVMGIEYAIHNSDIEELILVEKQIEFLPFIEKNVSLIKRVSGKSIKIKILIDSFEHQHIASSFSMEQTIAFCNPPFYIESQSLLNPDVNTNGCRHISLKDFRILVQSLFFEKRFHHLYFLKPFPNNILFEAIRLNQTFDLFMIDSNRCYFVFKNETN